jgi:ferritin
MDLSQKVFEDKTVEDLIKEVYKKQKTQETDIKREIKRLSDMISNPGDAIVLVPLLKGFFDSGLKNDETLLKMVQIFQKASEANKKEDDTSNGLLTQKDIDQLFEDIGVTKGPKEIADGE